MNPETSSRTASDSANRTAIDQPTSQDNTAENSANAKKASSTGLPQNALPIAAANALGGVKSLSGAAFAMHITPVANNQSGAAQENANQQGNSNSENASQIAEALSTTASSPSVASAENIPISSTAHAQAASDSAQGLGLSAPNVAAWSTPSSWISANGQSDAPSTVPTTIEVHEIAAEDPTGSPQTVRTVQVQLAGEGEGRVDLRLVQHADGLSVSVRASDSAITKGLQDNLPELTARLAAEKYQTHTFLPAANEMSNDGSSASSSEHSDAQAQNQSSNGSFSQGGDSRQSDGHSGDRHNSQQDQGAAWWRQIAALAKLSSSTSNSTSGTQTTSSVNPQANQ